jgi:hypothetical protein
MSATIRIVLALLLSGGLIFVFLDRGADKYIETVAAWLVPLAILILIPISLYTSQTRKLVLDQSGNPKPAFRRAAVRRQKMGQVLLVGSILVILVYLGISLLLDAKTAYELALRYEAIVIGPLVVLLPVGAYLSITNMCPYCCRLNSPKETACSSCDNPLEPTWVRRWIQH